ncbi:MAG: hypothetical protein R3E83_13580 [Burkholderiaceae bacterium]
MNQPYLGCREFAARFRLVELGEDGWPGPEEPTTLDHWSADLGWMLYDYDYGDPASPQPRFFRAVVDRGVLDLAHAEVRG